MGSWSTSSDPPDRVGRSSPDASRSHGAMRPLRLVAGSIVVYAIVACGSAVMGPSFGEATQDASTPHPIDAGQQGAALADALANPVPEASAQTLAPIVATENCDKTGQVGGTTVFYAEHAFPGKTANQLAGVQTLLTGSDVPGYTQSQGLASVRDGYAAVYCSAVSSAPTMSVTFICRSSQGLKAAAS
jgi:hypothetical protein